MPSPSPEFRRDPVSGRTVIVAPGRGERPFDVRRRTLERVERSCPFCRGHEGETPTALATFSDQAAGDAEHADWLVRVIPNKYPALAPIAELAETAHTGDAPDPASEFDALPALCAVPGGGEHEVIVESARHVTSFSQLDDRETVASVRAYRDRIRLHAQNESLRYVQVFKNCGHDAGASVEHIHSQLMATPFVPADVLRELDRSERFFQRQQRCMFCELLAREQAAGVRVVFETKRFLAYCPFAGRFPYETWILPHRHESRFDELEDADLEELGPLLRAVVGGTTGAAGIEAYNYLLHTAPFDTKRPDHYHWHIEMFPRTSEVGGYEWATGCFINSVPPEQAAVAIKARAQAFPTGKAS